MSSSYADDNSAYCLFPFTFQYETLAHSIPACFNNIKVWMNNHYLKLNSDKTEIVLFGHPKQSRNIVIHRTFLDPTTCIRFSDSVKHLGVWLDKSLQFNLHISKIVSICFANLCNIRSIRKFLTKKSTETLVHSMITCHLDRCNSLFFGISCANLKKLQSIQNSAIRIIFKLKKRDSLKSYLDILHWLNVEQRIYFKVILIIFKTIHNLAPPLLCNLITIKNSSQMTLETKFFFSSSKAGDRAFIFYAPRLCNSLPLALRTVHNVNQFKIDLKTFLFSSFEYYKNKTKILCL